MRRIALITTTLAALGLLAAGCGESAEDVSNSEYLLGLLQHSWNGARRSLNSQKPDLDPLRGVHWMLQRTPRRIQKDYEGSNKQEVLAKLKALREAYEAEVVPKLELRGAQVKLQSGVSLAEVRKAFMALDPQYRQIEAMTAPK